MSLRTRYKWVFRKDGKEKSLFEWCQIYKREYSGACKLARQGHGIERILRKSHGESKGGKPSKIYRLWCSMHSRCRNRKDKWYGGKGVTVCKRWNKFENFRDDMGTMPTPKHQIDRIKNHLGYSPKNCRWATAKENALNRSCTRWICFKGERKSLSQWAEYLGIGIRTLKGRIDYHGWPLEKALTGQKFKQKRVQ